MLSGCVVMKKQVTEPGFGEIIEKKSRFMGELYHIESADEAKQLVAAAKKKYYDARHHCYAYILGNNGENKKYGDDGEPQGTAGLPMLSVLEGHDLTDCIVIVTRYFGGTLLGTGGLVRAYSAAAEEAIKNAALAERVPGFRILIRSDYKNEGTIRRIVSNAAERGVCIAITDVGYSDRCDITVEVESVEAEAFEKNVIEALAGQVETDRKDEIFIMKK